MIALDARRGVFFDVRAVGHIYQRVFTIQLSGTLSFREEKKMAEELYHAFTVIPRLRYRVMVVSGQSWKTLGHYLPDGAGYLFAPGSAETKDATTPSTIFRRPGGPLLTSS
jgi:hypothetical protein